MAKYSRTDPPAKQLVFLTERAAPSNKSHLLGGESYRKTFGRSYLEMVIVVIVVGIVDGHGTDAELR